MHVVCTLHALCTLVVQNFDFSGGAQWRQPLTTHEKSKSCGATSGAFQFFQSSIGRRSSIRRRQNESSKGENKTKVANCDRARERVGGGGAKRNKVLRLRLLRQRLLRQRSESRCRILLRSSNFLILLSRSGGAGSGGAGSGGALCAECGAGTENFRLWRTLFFLVFQQVVFVDIRGENHRNT